MDQADVASQFMSLTNCNEAEASFYLEAADYNLDRAVAMFFGELSVDDFSTAVACSNQNSGDFGYRSCMQQEHSATATLCVTFADQPTQGLQHRSSAVTTTHSAPEAQAPPPQALHRPRRQRRGFLGQLFQLPIMVVGAGIKLCFEVVQFGYKCTTTVGSGLLPRSFTRTIQGERLARHHCASACFIHYLH